MADHVGDDQCSQGSNTITVPWRKTPSRQLREIILPEHSKDHRPARAETNRKLVAAIACGRRWLQEILSGSATIEAIAAREGCSIRRIDMMLQMTFLSPTLVKAAVEGRIPRGIGVSRLFGLSPEWGRQHQALGLPMT